MSHRVPLHEHLALPWRAHQLLADFTVEDVWRLPVVLTADHDLAAFRHEVTAGLTTLSRFHPARVLLTLRLGIGRLLGWDRAEEGHGPTLRSRYAAAERLSDTAVTRPATEFTEVYNLEDEYLSELENRTVHAALHLGRVPAGQDTFAVHLAVYVRPKGRFGHAYMAFIKPFRRWIVYPAILRATQRRWAAYRDGEPG